MAQYLYFARDTKVYIKIGAYLWEIPVLDGFSVSQATNSSEIVLAEMESNAGVSRRGKRMFNDALAPVEWSFTTYTRPFASTGGTIGTGGVASVNATDVHAVEEVLWALMAGPAVYDATPGAFENATGTKYFTWNSVGSQMTIDFDQSNRSTLGTADIFFVMGEDDKKYYKIRDGVVNEATINFDIDGIASIEWSGMGAELTETTSPGAATHYEGVTSTTNFIRNRLTTLAIVPVQASYNSGELEASYDVTLTGGSISISNNITYITPEELGIVNIPIGHVTGNRSISGNFTCYLVKDSGAANMSSNFWDDIKDLTTKVTHDLGLTFHIGGAAGNPRLSVIMPHCAIEIPTHSIEDIISLETSFSALPTTIDDTDEVLLRYYAL